MPSSAHFRPVLDAAGRCAGHLINTARGVVAFNRQDVQIGTFANEAEAAEALLQPIAD